MQRARRSAGIWFTLLLGVANAVADDPSPTAPDTVAALVAQATGPDRAGQDRAIDALLRAKAEDVVPALRRALEAEKGFHERVSLGYLLAAHGEKAGLEVLVASLERTGHLGYVYLTRAASEDFGWNQDGSSLAKWRAWLAGFTDDEYRRQAQRALLPSDVRRSGDDAFAAAAKVLVDGADRAHVAERFRGVAVRFPDSDAAPRALDVATALDVEAAEDAVWKEPAAPPAPGAPERVAWLVHHLRDVRAVERRSIHYATVLPPPRRGEATVETAATALLAMGEAAVPTLLGLLEDRRPIRAFAPTSYRVGDREWSGFVAVLRVQDAALEILNALLPTPTYERRYTATYLSCEDPPDRAATIADVRTWAAETLGKTAEERTWAALRRASVEDALAELRRLGVEGKKDAVLAELRRMYDGGRAAIYRPAICELLADLGDTSRVAEVIAALEAGDYTSHLIVEDGDRAVGFRAQAAAERVRAKHAAGAAKPAGGK